MGSFFDDTTVRMFRKGGHSTTIEKIKIFSEGVGGGGGLERANKMGLGFHKFLATDKKHSI